MGFQSIQTFPFFSMIISILNEHVFTDQKNKKQKERVLCGSYVERSASKMKIVDHVLDLTQKAVGE